MEGKIITWNNLKQYNTKRDEVVKNKIQATIPAESGYITYVTGTAGNKTINSTGFKYDSKNTAITTASNTPIIDLSTGGINIKASQGDITTINSTKANITVASVENLSITGESTLKQEEIEMDNSTESDIHSKSWSKVNPSLLDMRIVNRGNLFLYGEFRLRTDTNFCWFRIKSPKAPRSVNAAIKDANLDINMNAPIVYWDDTYIYIGIKGAFDSGISFTCFF